MNKFARYRQKMSSLGRCPHCGKPCAPYYECEDRRISSNFRKHLSRLVKTGMITKEQNHPWDKALYQAIPGDTWPSKRSHGYKIKDGDIRTFPRIGKKYADISELAKTCLEEAGEPLYESILLDRIMESITKMKMQKPSFGCGG